MSETRLTRHVLCVACALVGVGALHVTFHATSTTIGRERITWLHSRVGRQERNDDQSAMDAFAARSATADSSETRERRGRPGSNSMSSTYTHAH